MYQELEKTWSNDSGDYDDLIKIQLSNKRDVNYWQKELVAILGNKPLRVLDVGCGPGFFTIMMARLGHNVTAIDGAEGMVEHARKNLKNEGAEINVYCGDVVVLEEEENQKYDVIISRDVVWTLYDPEKAFARWKEVLKPNGKVVIYDGDYRKEIKSIKLLAWKCISNLLILITERKIYHKSEHNTFDDLFRKLPMVVSNRPQKDCDLLKEAGFKEVTVTNDKFRNSPNRLEFWKYGYQGKKFRVVAYK